MSPARIVTPALLPRCPPPAPVLLDELIGRGGAPGAGRIVREIARRDGAPDVQDRRGDPPRGLDHVVPMEEGRVADHAVVEQALVAGGGRRLAEIAIAEVEIDRDELDRGAGFLRLHPELDPLARLHLAAEAAGPDPPGGGR